MRTDEAGAAGDQKYRFSRRCCPSDAARGVARAVATTVGCGRITVAGRWNSSSWSAVVLDRATDALLERNRRLVPEVRAGGTDIGKRVAHVTETVGTMGRLDIGAELLARSLAAISLRVMPCPAGDVVDPPADIQPSASAATLALTTFSTYVKSRDCSPSPKITGASPSWNARMNFGITAAYSELGSWRGPNTLK